MGNLLSLRHLRQWLAKCRGHGLEHGRVGQRCDLSDGCHKRTSVVESIRVVRGAGDREIFEFRGCVQRFDAARGGQWKIRYANRMNRLAPSQARRRRQGPGLLADWQEEPFSRPDLPEIMRPG